jgi:hypothetical protein
MLPQGKQMTSPICSRPLNSLSSSVIGSFQPKTLTPGPRAHDDTDKRSRGGGQTTLPSTLFSNGEGDREGTERVRCSDSRKRSGSMSRSSVAAAGAAAATTSCPAASSANAAARGTLLSCSWCPSSGHSLGGVAGVDGQGCTGDVAGRVGAQPQHPGRRSPRGGPAGPAERPPRLHRSQARCPPPFVRPSGSRWCLGKRH